MLLEIPLNAIPNQQTRCILNNQQITVNVYLQGDSMFCDLYLAENPIILGMRACHGSYINQFASALNGYIFFWNDNGRDPFYTELDTTDHLYYANYDVLAIISKDWIDKLPTISLISPSSGTSLGGTSVTITGTNFTTASSVVFGNNESKNIVINNDTSITAISPPGNVGIIDVRVNNFYGTSELSYLDKFTYS